MRLFFLLYFCLLSKVQINKLVNDRTRLDYVDVLFSGKLFQGVDKSCLNLKPDKKNVQSFYFNCHFSRNERLLGKSNSYFDI